MAKTVTPGESGYRQVRVPEPVRETKLVKPRFAGVPGVCSFSTIGVCNSPVRKSHLPDLVPGDIQDLELSITSEFEDQIARFLIMESFHYLPTR